MFFFINCQFSSRVISVKYCFVKVSFRSSIVLIKCRFNQVCSMNFHSINCHNTIFFMINLEKYYFFYLICLCLYCNFIFLYICIASDSNSQRCWLTYGSVKGLLLASSSGRNCIFHSFVCVFYFCFCCQ